MLIDPDDVEDPDNEANDPDSRRFCVPESMHGGGDSSIGAAS